MSSPQSCDRFARVAFAIVLAFSCGLLMADTFSQTNLVSDIPGLAITTDKKLVEPWGVAFSPTSPFWVSNTGTATATLYDGAGIPNALTVSIPASYPTGVVFNSAGAGTFLVNGTASSFIFDTGSGAIAAWSGNAGISAVQMASTPGANYTGLALATSNNSPYLYAADGSKGQIHVFDSGWTDVTATTFAGKFVDPSPIAGYVPFNIQTIGSDLYVTYGLFYPNVFGMPGGYIDVYDTSGNFIRRFTTGGALYAPWGLVIAPPGFGSFGNDLLVGNSSGEILAFDPVTAAYLGTIDGPNGKPLTPGSTGLLRALETRTDGPGTDPNAVYFAAAIGLHIGGIDGLFGKIDPNPEPVPEPATILETVSGLIGMVLLRFAPHVVEHSHC